MTEKEKGYVWFGVAVAVLNVLAVLAHEFWLVFLTASLTLAAHYRNKWYGSST